MLTDPSGFELVSGLVMLSSEVVSLFPDVVNLSDDDSPVRRFGVV